MGNYAQVGAGWKKHDRNGKQFLSIVIEVNNQQVPMQLFPNTSKSSAKQPDYNVNCATDVAENAGIRIRSASPNASKNRVDSTPAPMPTIENRTAPNESAAADDDQPF